MKRPFRDKRPIGPFTSVRDGRFDLIGSGSELGKVHNAKSEINKAYSNTPEWAKDADKCVEWMASNIKDELVELLETAQQTEKEHTFSVCYDGSEVIVSQTESGAVDVAPSVSCGKDTWKLIEVHSHPKDAPIYPSVTDLRRVMGRQEVPIPTTLNEVIVAEDGLASCLNFYNFNARNDTIDVINRIEKSSKNGTLRIEELVAEHGAEFNLRSL